MYILSQVLIGLADLLYVGSMLQKKKTALILFLLFSDVLVALHYFCLNALTGSIIIFIDAIFLISSFVLEKFQKDKYVVWLVAAAMVSIVITTILTWSGPISLLPMFSILMYLVGMIFKNIVFIKIGAMIRNLLNVVYMLLITSYVGAFLELCLMVSAIIGIILSIKRKN